MGENVVSIQSNESGLSLSNHWGVVYSKSVKTTEHTLNTPFEYVNKMKIRVRCKSQIIIGIIMTEEHWKRIVVFYQTLSSNVSLQENHYKILKRVVPDSAKTGKNVSTSGFKMLAVSNSDCRFSTYMVGVCTDGKILERCQGGDLRKHGVLITTEPKRDFVV